MIIIEFRFIWSIISEMFEMCQRYIQVRHYFVVVWLQIKIYSIKKKLEDFIFFLKQKLNGGTTVSGTMVVANLVGIQIFVTGGIGGVHYGVQESE